MSTSGYYYWLKHPVGSRELKERELVERIKLVHQQSMGRYGSPGIAAELKVQGILASRPRIA